MLRSHLERVFSEFIDDLTVTEPCLRDIKNCAIAGHVAA